MRLEAKAVSVKYRGTGLALDQVTCQAEGGKLLAVVGPNGSGKTTLVRALSGLVPLHGGGVTIDGKPLGGWERRALAQVMAVVPQGEDAVFPLRVDEAVMLGRYPHLGAFAAPRETDRSAVRDALLRCDVAHLAGRTIDTLSGGEWQRVRVARALAQDPRILVLDEPTTSLDIRHEMELFELVRRLTDQGLAGLVVTHHINLAARFSHRMVLLSGGRVAADGTPAAVLRADALREVFGWPVAVTAWRDGSPQLVPLRPHEADQA